MRRDRLLIDEKGSPLRGPEDLGERPLGDEIPVEVCGWEVPRQVAGRREIEDARVEDAGESSDDLVKVFLAHFSFTASVAKTLREITGEVVAVGVEAEASGLSPDTGRGSSEELVDAFNEEVGRTVEPIGLAVNVV